jgi:hypothetical protein
MRCWCYKALKGPCAARICSKELNIVCEFNNRTGKTMKEISLAAILQHKRVRRDKKRTPDLGQCWAEWQSKEQLWGHKMGTWSLWPAEPRTLHVVAAGSAPMLLLLLCMYTHTQNRPKSEWAKYAHTHTHARSRISLKFIILTLFIGQVFVNEQTLIALSRWKHKARERKRVTSREESPSVLPGH